MYGCLAHGGFEQTLPAAADCGEVGTGILGCPPEGKRRMGLDRPLRSKGVRSMTTRRELLTAALWPAGLALAWSAAPVPARAAAPELGEPVRWPEVSLLDGGHFGPADARARAVVVVFWATTCPFCQRHNRHIEKLHRAAAGRALTVLTAARDADPSVVRRYRQVQGYTFPITLDWPALAEALGARPVIPLTLAVDRQGRLRSRIPGEMFEEDVLELLQLAA
jgi:thiol-disulfide isomerase/thioredoxin